MRLIAGLIVIAALFIGLLYPGYLWRLLPPQAQPGTTAAQPQIVMSIVPNPTGGYITRQGPPLNGEHPVVMYIRAMDGTYVWQDANGQVADPTKVLQLQASAGTTSSSQSASSSTQAKAAPTSNPSVGSSGSNGDGLLRKPNEGFTTPYDPPSTQPDAVQARRAHITGPEGGVSNVWAGVQLDVSALAPLKANEMYLAHGDVAGTGGCQVWYWIGEGKKPSGLSQATWQLYHVQGVNDATLEDDAAVQQLIASYRDIPTCKAFRK